MQPEAPDGLNVPGPHFTPQRKVALVEHRKHKQQTGDKQASKKERSVCTAVQPEAPDPLKVPALHEEHELAEPPENVPPEHCTAKHSTTQPRHSTAPTKPNQ